MAQAITLLIFCGQGQFLALHDRRHLHAGDVQQRRRFTAQAGNAFAKQREVIRADTHSQTKIVDSFANHVARFGQRNLVLSRRVLPDGSANRAVQRFTQQ
ncbi:hypothetical protein D3C80_1969290 [compost metagenome]